MRLWKISVIFLLLILTIGAASASEDASENITAGSNDDSMEIANGDIDNILEITQEAQPERPAITIRNWPRTSPPLKERLT